MTAISEAVSRQAESFKLCIWRRRLWRTIVRDASRLHPYPWDEAARTRYIFERYCIESIDRGKVMALLRKHREGEKRR